MYLVGDPRWLWVGVNGFFRTMNSSSPTPSVAVMPIVTSTEHANHHVKHHANHHVNEPPSSCRWSWCHRGPRQRRRRPWLHPREPPGGRPSPEKNHSRNHHIDLGLVHLLRNFALLSSSASFSTICHKSANLVDLGIRLISRFENEDGVSGPEDKEFFIHQFIFHLKEYV